MIQVPYFAYESVMSHVCMRRATDINNERAHTHAQACEMLPNTATHCNDILQHAATQYTTMQHFTVKHTHQHTAAHCNTLQHTAAHCNTLQHTATHCHTLMRHSHTCKILDQRARHLVCIAWICEGGGVRDQASCIMR